jgi:hypothetical protein
MEVADSLRSLNMEAVASSVSRNELRRVQGHGMEWLVQVANVVNEIAKSN